jgi:hypothetical protein
VRDEASGDGILPLTGSEDGARATGSAQGATRSVPRPIGP